MVISNLCKAGIFVFLFLIVFGKVMGQQPDTTIIDTTRSEVNKARLTGLIVGGSVIYAGTMFGLYQLWYKDYPQSSFHFINDNDEWLQLDKCGHATTAYYLGMVGYESFRWAGVGKRKSAWYGGSLGFMYLTVIEILDGFSAEWGASGGDLLANTFGSAAFISQQLIWEEQRFQIKWSVHLTDYAQYNPELLGRNILERVVKDYNGHTYWISANIHSFLKNESRFPKWLNVAAGYGGEGMTGASSNPSEIDGVPLPYFERYRKYYIAPDIDLSKIKTGSQTLNLLLKYLGIFKFPLPTLEFSNKGVKFHAVYF
ncbi:MAG: DUF2279 domain-containing protein [Lentimicrobium sp.]